MSRHSIDSGKGPVERIQCDNCGTAVAPEDADGWAAVTVEPIISLSFTDVNLGGTREFCGMGCVADWFYRTGRKYAVDIDVSPPPSD
jgi:hypothetical protein